MGIFSASIEELRLPLIFKSHVVHNPVSFSYWGPTSGSHILPVVETSNSGFLPRSLQRAPSRSPTLGQRRLPGWEEVSQRLGPRSRPRGPGAGRGEAGAGLRSATGGIHLPSPARPPPHPAGRRRRRAGATAPSPPTSLLHLSESRAGRPAVAARSSLAGSREPRAAGAPATSRPLGARLRPARVRVRPAAAGGQQRNGRRGESGRVGAQGLGRQRPLVEPAPET